MHIYIIDKYLCALGWKKIYERIKEQALKEKFYDCIEHFNFSDKNLQLKICQNGV